MQVVVGDGGLAIIVPDHEIGVGPDRDCPLARVQAVHLGRIGCGERDERREIESAEGTVGPDDRAVLDLGRIDRLDGSGAVLLARLLDRLEDDGHPVEVDDGGRPQSARLIALYRQRRGDAPGGPATRPGFRSRARRMRSPTSIRSSTSKPWRSSPKIV